MPDEPNSTGDRQTRAAEPYRLPPGVVGSTGDQTLDEILRGIKESAEMELELNFKSLDGNLTNADRVIGNQAAMSNLRSDPVAMLQELAKVNFTE